MRVGMNTQIEYFIGSERCPGNIVEVTDPNEFEPRARINIFWPSRNAYVYLSGEKRFDVTGKSGTWRTADTAAEHITSDTQAVPNG